MGETWLTSDTHLGHDFVSRLRGFENHVEHDAHLARIWDRRVRDDDEVWVLGDIAMNGWADRMQWFSKRPGTKHLVLGNHDRAHPSRKNAHSHLKHFRLHFNTVQTTARLENILLSHFPYDGDHGEDRHTQWRLRDEGAPLAHGHLHDDVKARLSAQGTPMVHVGLDAWGLSPVTLHDVKTQFIGLFQEKPEPKPDEFEGITPDEALRFGWSC